VARILYRGEDLPAQLFSETVYNVDDTETATPGDTETVSYLDCCDICGTVFDDEWKMYRSSTGKRVCRLCLDTNNARKPIPNNLPFDTVSGDFVVDKNGDFVVDENGDYVIKLD